MGLNFYSSLWLVNLTDCYEIECRELVNSSGKCGKECKIRDRSIYFKRCDEVYDPVYAKIFVTFYTRQYANQFNSRKVNASDKQFGLYSGPQSLLTSS